MIHIIKQDGSIKKYLMHGNGAGLNTFEKIIDLPSSKLAGISIETDGKATILGKNDSRKAAWIIRNMNLTPVTP